MEDKEKDWYSIDPDRDDYYDEFASPNYIPDGDMEEAKFWRFQFGDAVYYVVVLAILIWIASRVL